MDEDDGRTSSPTTIAQRLAASPASREVVPPDLSQSARWHTHGVPGHYAKWNYHPECEIHLIRVGTGRYIVGDHIGTFSAGQVVLVGPNLPHHWISDLARGQAIQDRDVVFQFHPDWINQCQEVLPELADVQALLTKATRGIEFSGETALRAAYEIEAIGEHTGSSRLQHMFGLLSLLIESPADEQHILIHEELPLLRDDRGADTIDQALAYILDHLTETIRLPAIAEQLGMSDSAFSKYFKRVSGQTFSKTVQKLRLAQASKLLTETDLAITLISHRVGYDNLSNFNRQFRSYHNATPREFRQRHRN